MDVDSFRRTLLQSQHKKCGSYAMELKDHCKESIRLFGKPFREVHMWLDALMGTPGIGIHHRKYRHHEEGIEKVIKMFGKEAGIVARQHIVSDLKQSEWNKDVHPFPKNMNHYEELGFF